MVVIEVLGKTEQHPAAIAGVVNMRRAPALERLELGRDLSLFGLNAGRAQGFFAVEEGAPELRNPCFEQS